MYYRILSLCFLAFLVFQLSTLIEKGTTLPMNLLEGLLEILFLSMESIPLDVLNVYQLDLLRMQ